MKLPKRRAKQVPVGRQRPQRQTAATPSAFSYHSQRSERHEATGRQEKQRQTRTSRNFFDFWVKRTGFLIGGIIVLVCVISIVSLSSSPRVISLNSAPTASIFARDEALYQSTAAKDLSSSIWNHNKLTINTDAVSAKLKTQFPELTNVSVTLPLLGHRPIIYIQTTEPAFVYNAINGSYVLDESGVALADTSQLNLSKLSLPVVTDQTGQHVSLGHAVLTSSNTTFIRTVIAELAAKRVAIGALILPSGAADELDVHLSGVNYYVKFNMYQGSDARQQAGTFLAVQAKLKSENIVPTQYIDVRVDGRGYYQ